MHFVRNMTGAKIRDKAALCISPCTSMIQRFSLKYFTSIWILCIKLGELPNMLLNCGLLFGTYLP
jgi:hypothetical protein